MLQAEEEGLITIDIEVREDVIGSFAQTLVRCCRSDAYGEISKEWNELREAVCWDVTRRLLLPMGAKWLRERLRGEAEDFIAERCRMELEFVSGIFTIETIVLVRRTDRIRESTCDHIKAKTWKVPRHRQS